MLVYAPEPGQNAARFADDSPPTLMMDPTRVTNEASWQKVPPLAAWQNQSPLGQNQPYGLSPAAESRNQTLPTVSLIMAVFSCFMVCCAGGVWLGLPAAVIGYLGMRNADREPGRYAGRGLAIAGMVTGIVTFLASIIILVISAID